MAAAMALIAGCTSMNSSPDPLTRFACSKLKQKQESLQACLDAAPGCALTAADMHAYRKNQVQLAACYPKATAP